MSQTCIITDDEPLAIEILEDYIKMVPGLELIAKCKDAMETWSVLRSNRVDILFMDIKMPGINGLEFVRSLSFRPVIVFTTAFPQYAIDGFDLEVIDYLLKPISFERFLKAVSKAVDKCGMTVPRLRNEDKDEIQHKSLFIKSEKGSG